MSDANSPTVGDCCRWLELFAPPKLAESWDNVGLLVGDRQRPAARVMTCLTMTPATVEEAVERRADLVVTHHPLPFKPLGRITTDETPGRLLWRLIGAGVSIYSAHTAYDSALFGINQRLADGLELTDVRPLVPIPNDDERLGAGRSGSPPPGSTVRELVAGVKRLLRVSQLQFVGELDRAVRRVAIGCGSGATFLAPARRAGCDLLLTGEANFHACLEAEATGVALILPGHFASERFAMEQMAEALAVAWPQVQVWASEHERDPLIWC